jgi:hypothetical protein
VRRVSNWAAGVLGGLVLGLIWFYFSEPYLVFAGTSPPPQGQFEANLSGPQHVLRLISDTTFRNWGLKPGHIGKVEVINVGLTPSPEKVTPSCDQTPVGALRKKDIKCEFWVWIDALKARNVAMFEFRIIFYAPDGREIYRDETIRVHPMKR